MKILIKESGKSKINLHFPLSGMFLGFCFRFIKKEKKELNWIEPKLIRQCISELKYFRKINGKFELVHVESADGSEVLIRI